MFRKLVLIFFIILTIIGCSKQKSAEKEFDFDSIEPNMEQFPENAYNFFKGYLSEKNQLELNSVHHAFNTLDKLLPITYKMIESSDSELKKLEKEANKIAQAAGYKSLENYGKRLNDITWAAATYIKLCKFDKTLPLGINLPINRFSQENITKRLEKQKLSKQDLELMQNNWALFDESLDDMRELAQTKIDFKQN